MLKKRNDSGFTLLEAIIVVVITGLLLAVAGPLLTSISTSLGRTADATIATQSALRASRMLRYDFSGSQSIYVFPTTAPAVSTAAGYACTSALYKYGNFSSWGTASNWKSAKVIRPLFTLDVVDLPYDKSATSIGWIKSQRLYVGYEVRRDPTTLITSSPYELWRLVCDGTTKLVGSTTVLDVISEERLAVIGDGSDAPPATTAGVTNLKCGQNTTPPVTATCDTSGAVRAPFYTLSFPYATTGNAAVLRGLIDSSLGTLQSKLGTGS